MNFEFVTPGRIIFGAGRVAEVGNLAAGYGRQALVVTGSSPDRAGVLFSSLEEAGIGYVTYAVDKEPTVDMVGECVQTARDSGCDMIVSIGGGSVIDTGKATAAMLANEGNPLDYMEVIGKGQKITQVPAPHIALPTTAGTGTEVTRNAVIASPGHRQKVSMLSPLLIPAVALVDPELTYSCPPEVTAYSGMDALAQVLEPYVSKLANPLTDALCREGIFRAATSLETAYEAPHDVEAHEDMALASLFGGLALANAKLGAAHGFAGVLGGRFDIPHGLVIAMLLPHVVSVNIQALIERDSESEYLERYDEIAGMVTGDFDAEAADLVDWLLELSDALNIPRLRTYGIGTGDLAKIAEDSANTSSMKGNPIDLTYGERRQILEAAL